MIFHSKKTKTLKVLPGLTIRPEETFRVFNFGD
jgi:hypothetical protein